MSATLSGVKMASVASLVAAAAHAAPDWKSLPSLPDPIGFAGSYAGATGAALIVAGGANFPDKSPAEGGTKTWYDRVFLLEAHATTWRDAGRLPNKSGYGISVALDEGLLLIGGGDARQNFSDVWLARWDGHSLKFAAWPRLPRPFAMAAGARVGQTVYVTGGLERPDATRAQDVFYSLNLDDLKSGWRELPSWPGPERMLATAAALDGKFYLFSGAQLVSDAQGKPTRAWLRDAYCFTPGSGWKRLADLPRAAVAAPSPAPNVDGKLLVIGGDDGTQVGVAPTEHQGFPRDILAYDPATNHWGQAGEVPFSLVTTTLAQWQGKIVIPGGERRPGVRSTEVWATEVR